MFGINSNHLFGDFSFDNLYQFAHSGWFSIFAKNIPIVLDLCSIYIDGGWYSSTLFSISCQLLQIPWLFFRNCLDLHLFLGDWVHLSISGQLYTKVRVFLQWVAYKWLNYGDRALELRYKGPLCVLFCLIIRNLCGPFGIKDLQPGVIRLRRWMTKSWPVSYLSP